MKNRYTISIIIICLINMHTTHGSRHPDPKKISMKTEKHRIVMYSGTKPKFEISFANKLQQLLGSYIPVLKASLINKNAAIAVVRARRKTSWCGDPVYEEQEHLYDAKTGELLSEGKVKKVPLYTEEWEHIVEYENLSRYTYYRGPFKITSCNLAGPYQTTKDEWVKHIYDETETDVKKLHDKFSKTK